MVLATVISVATFLSYVFLYTAFDKIKKKLILKNIEKLWKPAPEAAGDADKSAGPLIRIPGTLELNKALSLSGLTTMLISFLPISSLSEVSRELLFQSIIVLWYHSVYSFYKFYSYRLDRIVKEKPWPTKQISIVLGVLGQLIISGNF